MSHKYRLKQIVRIVRKPVWDPSVPADTLYEIVRLLPADHTGEVSYRVVSGGVERAVQESELRAVVDEPQS